MKHAGIVKALIGWVLLALAGCQQSEQPTSPVAPQNPQATRSVDPAGAATTAKNELDEADFPGPPANALSTPPQTNPGPPAGVKAAASGTPGVPASASEAAGTERPEMVPLVDHLDQLQPLHQKYPIWFDKQEGQVVLVGQICQNRAPLELFACQRGSKEHESIVSIDVLASLVHTGLLLAKANPGNPVRYQPEFAPASGPEIEVTVVWQDEQGQRHQARGQDWVRHMQTGKAMEYPWVFAGSVFLTDEQTGREYYQADGEGDLICVSNFPSAVLDVPVESSDSNDALLFEAFTERIPPLGTPVTLLLKPKLGDQPQPKAPAASGVVHPNEF